MGRRPALDFAGGEHGGQCRPTGRLRRRRWGAAGADGLGVGVLGVAGHPPFCCTSRRCGREPMEIGSGQQLEVGAVRSGPTCICFLQYGSCRRVLGAATGAVSGARAASTYFCVTMFRAKKSAIRWWALRRSTSATYMSGRTTTRQPVRAIPRSVKMSLSGSVAYTFSLSVIW